MMPALGLLKLQNHCSAVVPGPKVNKLGMPVKNGLLGSTVK